jgi:2-dehydropantoate 2-reductase
VILGAGGIGGFLAAHLAPTRHDVHLVARGEHLRVIREQGLGLVRPDGTRTSVPVAAHEDAAAIGPADVVFVCVKTFQLPGVVGAVQAVARPGTAVVTTQNGVEAPAQAAAALPEQVVVPGVVRVVSLLERSGVVRHVGGVGTVTLGDLDGRSGPAELVRAVLADGSVLADVVADIRAELWQKFLFIAPFGGLGAVTGATIGELRSAPAWRELLREAMAEVEATARARGVELDADVTGQTLRFVDAQPPSATSSLQRDVAAGRPSELDAWTGAVVRLGRESGVPVPVNAVFHRLLTPRAVR